jgi:hypothetical protein
MFGITSPGKPELIQPCFLYLCQHIICKQFALPVNIEAQQLQ